ncbi:MAG: hypothetical protein HWN66_22365, partial [Candidatus Helarchaeota archaeon]|nr:hypothetical protein [Candidatus Helarchaeota archaeon]
TDELIGPFYIKSSDSSQERNPDSFWSNGLFWTFSVNNSDNWAVEYTSCRRADLTSFSTLATDFIPLIFNWEQYTANMSVYFTLDLGTFTNDLLEAQDRVRFIVSLEYDDSQFILLDTDWNNQELETWIENNLASYYPRYLRYYYNLSLTSLTFLEINATDPQIQDSIYPFEVQFPYPVNFTEHFNLRFNFIKDDWSLNATYDMDRYRLGIDNIDISFEIIPKNSTTNTFGVLTKSDEASSYSKSEFLVTNKVNLNDLDCLIDPNLIPSDSNLVDLLVDFDAFSLLYDPLRQLYFAPTSSLDCKMMIMVESDINPDIVISNELVYDSFTGYNLGDINLDSQWTKDFGV